MPQAHADELGEEDAKVSADGFQWRAACWVATSITVDFENPPTVVRPAATVP
jgi:hypothetical protein